VEIPNLKFGKVKWFSYMYDEDWFSNLETELSCDTFFTNRVFRSRPDPVELNLKNRRPLKHISSNDLRSIAKIALQRNWAALEIATLALEEAKIRVSKGGSQKTLDMILNAFSKKRKHPIIWLEAARRQLRSNLSSKNITGGIGSVYFVLVGGFTEVNQFYGCYVGQTKTTNLGNFQDNQSARIANHFQGNRASLRVRNRGIEPLWSLNCFTQNLTDEQEEIIEFETAFHNSLQQVIPKVLGDTI
jgi:hypothetical protein